MANNANTNDESAAPERLLSEQETADLTFGGSLYLLRRHGRAALVRRG